MLSPFVFNKIVGPSFNFAPEAGVEIQTIAVSRHLALNCGVRFST